MKKILYIYILLQPFLDVITGIMLNNFGINFSINIIVKGITILLLFIYIIFISKSKYKKISIICLLVLFIYFILYFLTKSDIFHIQFLIDEVTYAFKYFYYIIMFLGLINLFDDFDLEKEKIYKYLSYALFFYSLFILIPFITNTGFYSYNERYNGIRGWFTSANELSSMFALLIPFSFYLINDKVKKWMLIIIPISLLSLGLIGTKASLLGVVLIILFFMLFFMIKIKNKKINIMIIILLLVMALGIRYLPSIEIFKNNITAAEILVDENSTFIDKVITYTLRVRKNLFTNTQSIYNEQNSLNKLFGIGFSNRESINNPVIEKLVEIDIADIFFRYGIIGTILYFTPIIYVLSISIKKIINEKNLNFYIFQNMFTVLIGVGISIFAGHVFGAPSVSIYLSLAMAILSFETNDKKYH